MTGTEPDPHTDGELDDTDDDGDDEAGERTRAGSERADADGLVTLSNVEKRFGEVRVLDGVSVSVAPGEVTAVIGPNGSGKSTLLQLVVGVRTPTDGEVVVRAAGDRRVGYLPQRPAFRSGFTVEDTLTFYADLVDAPVDVRAVLRRVGLESVRDRKVGALSGGMMRLLGLAQSVVGDPPLLVLDEPASGLDPAMAARIFERVSALAGEGTAVLIASHSLPAVERTADRVLLLDDGGLLADGSPADLLAETGTDSLEDAFLAFVQAEADGVTVRAGGGANAGGDDR